MGKAIRTTLKIAALAGAAVLMFVPGANVAAAAFIASTLGVSAAVAGAIVAVGISLSTTIGASALAPRPRLSTTRTNTDRLRASIDPRAPRKTVWGTTAMATDIRDQEFTGDQEFLHSFIVVAAHKVHAISEIWFDDELAWSAGGGVASKFSGYLLVTPILEGSAANAINISSRMGSSRRYTGCAYVYLRYKLTGNGKKAESPFAQGVTSRITIRGNGAFAYDPRQDSTVPGGSGAHRANDQSTWTWGAHCRNPAIAMLNYLLGWHINGELSVGKGIPPSRIDLPSFAVAANICDELVAKPGGGTEPRYRCDGLWSEGDNPNAVTDILKATMNADLDDMNGRLRLTVFHNDLATPAADFDDDDILGDFVWTPVAPIEDTINIVRGGYTDASNQSLYQMVDYPQAETASIDGIDRIDTFDLPLVQSAGQAQRLAGLRLRRNQFGGTFKCELQVTGWRIEKNSVIRLSFLPRGWVNKLFRVMEMDLRTDGIVPVVLREEDPDLYDDGGLLSPISALEPTPFDYRLDPAYQVLTTVTRNVPRGIYDNAATYIEGDQVVFSGSTYQLTVASSTGNAPPDATRWVLVAAAGTGVPGADGAPGYSVLVSNESHTVATAADGTGGTYTSAGGTMQVIRGATVLAPAFSIAAATPGTGWITINSTTGVYTVTDPGVDLATATLRATVDGINFDRTYTLAKSKQGVSSPTVRLTADAQGFVFTDNVADPSSQTITLTADLQGLAGPATFTTSPTVALSGTGNTRTLALADFGGARQVTVTATVGALSDRITIVRVDRSTAAAGATVGAPQGTAIGGVPVEIGYALTPTGMFEDFSKHGTLAAVQRAWTITTLGSVNLGTDGNMSGGWMLEMTGETALIGKHRIPYSYEDLYRVRARVFVSDLGGGGNYYYLGITAFNSAGAELVPSDIGTYHYFGGANVPTSTGFYEWEGYFRGRALVGTGASVGLPAPDPSNPRPVKDGAVMVAPIFLANYSGTDGQARLDYISIEKVEDLTLLPSRVWNSTDFQKRGQVVSYLGRSWIARIDNTGVTPPSTSTGTATWGLLADKGVDGAPGAPGADGDPGVPAFAVSLSRPTVTLAAESSGALLPGELAKAAGQIVARYAGVDVTSSCTFAVVGASSGVAGTVTSGGAYSLTSFGAVESGTITLRVTYDPPGAEPPVPVSIDFSVAKSPRGAAAVRQLDGALTTPTTTMAPIGRTVVMPVSNGASISISASVGFLGSGTSGSRNVRLKASWRFAGGTTWTDVSAFVTGTASVWNALDVSWEPGSCDYATSLSGFTADAAVEIRLEGQSLGGPLASFGGLFAADRAA